MRRFADAEIEPEAQLEGYEGLHLRDHRAVNLAALAEDFKQAATGKPSDAVAALRPAPVMEAGAPTMRISTIFPYQSFCDPALRERGVVAQPPNDPIVPLAADPRRGEVQCPGYAIGLHPSSQTPVAIEFRTGEGQKSSSAPLILKPGQIERPHGLPRGSRGGAFSGFRWGLPFGWLGGGLATLHVFQTSDADVAWPGDSEVLFHRTSMIVQNTVALPANAPLNWPLRFPWPNAVFGALAAVGNAQGGSPSISIARPTRVIMRLRMTALAVATDVRVVWQNTNDFDLTAAGAASLTPCGFQDTTWGAFAGSGGAGNLAAQWPMQEFTGGPLNRLAADGGGIVLIDVSGGKLLVDQSIDICRYGHI
jgi:hypothetical protein